MRNRWTAMLLLVCLVFGLVSMSSTALADSYTVYVASNTLKVYQKATSSSKVLGTMAFGEKMTCTATDDDWAKVKNSDGDVGYCKLSGLTTKNPNNMDDEVFINRSGVSVYRKPSSSADVMMKITDSNLDTTYIAVGRTSDGEWYRLKNGKYYGYVKAKYVSFVSESGSDADDADKEESSFPELNETVYIADNTLVVYQKASTSTKQLGTMSYGEQLILVTVEGEWAKVKNASGAVGYCKLSGLTTKDPNVMPVVAYATENKVKVYAKPLTSAKELTRLSSGDEIELVALTGDGEWARAIVSGSYGYVQTKYLVLDSMIETPGEDEPSDDQNGAEESISQTVYIDRDLLTFYEKASTDTKQLGTMSYGESLTLLAVEDGWAKVQNSAGTTGYCLYGSLTAENPNNLSQTIYAAAKDIYIYAKPSTSAKVVDVLDLNESMTLIAITSSDDWGRVILASGEVGYIQRSDASTSIYEEEAPKDEGNIFDDAVASGDIDRIIALAKQQLGDPYVYAASGPDKFDCSGFVYYCYKEITGIKLQRTAYAQGYDESYTKIESMDDLRKGDLVFFNTNSSDSDLSDHSGIYIGGGQFIHASSAAAKVITSDLSNGYYQRTFSWGRRVL